MAAMVGRTTNNIVAAHSGSPDKKSDTFGSFPREAPGVAQVISLPEFTKRMASSAMANASRSSLS
jgi:hypothetical protein